MADISKLEQQANLLMQNVMGWEQNTLNRIGKRIKRYGKLSLSNNTTNELEITVEAERGIYKKHYVYLNEWTIYVVEDVSGAYVSPYHYEVNFLPEMIVPVTFTMHD